MKSFTTLLLLSAVIGTVFSAGGACTYNTGLNDATNWNYLVGGSDWECGDCKVNKGQQSPIDVVLPAKGTAGFKDTLKAHVDVPDTSQTVDLILTPTTVKIDMKPSSTTQTMWADQRDGTRKHYKALQFHFHAPSEHKINGKLYDLCIHTVNALTSDNTDKGRSYAVLGYVFQMDEYAPDMPWLAKIIKDLPSAPGTVTSEFDWESFTAWVPLQSRFWHYEGGLTTPGCTEAVNWYINQNVFKINPTQLKVFNDMWVKSSFNNYAKQNGLAQGNNRIVMPLGARLVHTGSVEYELGTETKKQFGAFITWVLMPFCGLLCLGAFGFAIMQMAGKKPQPAPQQPPNRATEQELSQQNNQNNQNENRT